MIGTATTPFSYKSTIRVIYDPMTTYDYLVTFNVNLAFLLVCVKILSIIVTRVFSLCQLKPLGFDVRSSAIEIITIERVQDR